MEGGRGRFVSLPVLAVISLIGLVYYTTVFVFIDDLLGLGATPGLLNALIFSWIAFMCLFSFFVAVLTDPGSIPSFFAPDTEDSRKAIAFRQHFEIEELKEVIACLVKKQASNVVFYGRTKHIEASCHSARDAIMSSKDECLKYCDKCSTYKPPRTHHCRVCRRCVLKMDHHCVWIGNCVGYANYKPFLICVFYAALASIYSMVLFFTSIFAKIHDFEGVSNKIFCVLCGSVISLLSLALGSLLVWHIYLLIHNTTTIEYRIAVRAMWLAKKSGQKYRHRFDLGVYNNVIMILGPNVLKWFCPTATGHLKDGTRFPVSKVDQPPDPPTG